MNNFLKYSLFLFSSVLLLNCEDQNSGNSFGTGGLDSLPHSVLYGLSYFDTTTHFVKVDAGTRTFTVLSTLDTITSITGQTVIDPNRGYYCFISENKLVVIRIADGSEVKSFTLDHPNTGSLQYNSQTNLLNGLSWFNGQSHFVEIDIAREAVNVVRTLPSLTWYNTGSISIDNEDRRYYVVSQDTVRAINTENGMIANTYILPDSPEGLRSMGGGKLFGMDFSSGKRFFTFDSKTREVTILPFFNGALTGYASVDVRNGFYFYFSDNTTLNCINVKTGYKVASILLPYQTNELIPLGQDGPF